MSALFYVHYQANQMLAATVDLSIKAEVAHRRICDWSWSRECMPPYDVPTLAAIARCTPEEWPAIEHELQRTGRRVARKRFSHPVARAVLCRARKANAAASRAGRLGAEVRWRGKGPSTLTKTDADAPCASHAPAMATPLAPPMPRQCQERLTIKKTINEKDL